MDNQDNLTRPLVLCLGGHDPSGGAGILADAEAVAAAGAFAVTVITALTEQNTCGLRQLHPQPPAQIAAHCRTLMADQAPAVLKIGLIGSALIAETIGELCAAHPTLPVILDPVLATGAGQTVADAALLQQLRERLIPRCLLITPNLPEAQTITGAQLPDECAAQLLALGTRWVLITGTHDDTAQVTNRLYGADGTRQHWDWPRLPGEYHGSGCTLTSAIAGRLAMGMPLLDAVAQAQQFTWHSLRRAFRTGRCQLTPNRSPLEFSQ
ncbi:hydroxymethylpyrimidine/phosphomethylpyrimidine kinase [Chromatium okenii]|uniref:bifunctional hydroxymethylpyrimidine kinase/phosphomethylpyrimidine kinase n=1 Tax=Chromatium okenii TaxID=61644 RepID=UPI0026EDC6CF|nr:hydroxymethylpyrimidine/phosphomethylpyrimidine kinase [Chromatium okenii]MBV5308001.1 hydroxymethylpyrimidine/phosphomethylpyrimidine kinase [Chromatium okenii]